ncbi:LemA family protein [Phytohabitans flavus]|uniref:LemA family protein n=1 Tax=Phytohabitans flavus TaxID=1076124 RepID=UPI00363534FB
MSSGGVLGVVGGLVCLLAVIVLVWGLSGYNRLVRQRNQVQGSWAQIDVQLKRRHDLIPNLVETVRGTPHTSGARSTRWWPPVATR